MLLLFGRVRVLAGQLGNTSPTDAAAPAPGSDSAVVSTPPTPGVVPNFPGLGGSIMLIGKVGFDHHPHGLEQDPTPVVNFVLTNALRANGLSP